MTKIIETEQITGCHGLRKGVCDRKRWVCLQKVNKTDLCTERNVFILTAHCQYPSVILYYSFARCYYWGKLGKAQGFPGGPTVKNPPANTADTGDMGSIPGPGRSPGEGHGNPLQCSCLENPMDRGAWRATVHRVSKQTQLSNWAYTCNST